jgi:hypothetical protein
MTKVERKKRLKELAATEETEDFVEECQARVIELVPSKRGAGFNAPTVSKAKNSVRLKPATEMAIRMYALGKYSTEQAMAASGLTTKARWSMILNSPAGQACMTEVRGELEHKFQAQFSKVIDVLDQGLDHPEPSVALASASLWLKTNRGSKVEVKVTAEDLVQQLMGGGQG